MFTAEVNRRSNVEVLSGTARRNGWEITANPQHDSRTTVWDVLVFNRADERVEVLMSSYSGRVREACRYRTSGAVTMFGGAIYPRERGKLGAVLAWLACDE
jgi:hypothetical protein